MPTITGLTADRMLEIEAASIVDGDVVGDNLILTRKNGTEINAGSVRGPQGDPGPIGSDHVVLTARSILDVGMVDQIRAGRQLSATDFTDMGLSAPIGLYNLSSVADSSGNGRSLTNRGSTPFDVGINGLASTAARFAGGATQGLYIADTGASDPFRVRTMSMGCWFRSGRRDVLQGMISKYSVEGQLSYWMVAATGTPNVAQVAVSPNGTAAASKTASGMSDVCDNRWHFVVATFDAAVLRLYVDGVLEGFIPMSGPIFASTSPFNIGSLALSASTSAIFPSFGLIDEAFITSDVLSEDQIRNLYCAKIPHTLGATPKRASVNVSRVRKGAALISGDFPTAPLRLHNFSAGSLSSEGSQATALTNNGGAVTVTGVDGSPNNAYYFNGAQSLSSSDTGLPASTSPWSFGQWMCTSIGTGNPSPGAYGTGQHVLHYLITPGLIVSRNNISGDDMTGPFVADGEWHFIVTTAHNAPADGGKRKLYVDGKLVAVSTVLNAITLAGANGYRIGSGNTGTLPFNGSVDSAFVCNYALTADEIMALYLKGAQSLGISPKNPGDHIEKMNSSDLLCVFDTLEMQHQIDLAVS